MSLRPNKARMKVLIVFLCFSLILDIANAISGYFQWLLLRNAQNGVIITQEEATSNDLRVMSIALVTLVVSITTIVVFIMWFRRGYFNLHQKTNHLKYTEGWAAGAWFVPIMNLFRPVQIMSEMSNKTYELLVDNKLINRPNRLKWIIPVWWTLWIIVNQIGNITSRQMFKSEDTIESLISSTSMDIVSSIASIPLTIITILMVLSYSKLEDLLPQTGDENGKRDIKSDEHDLLDTI